MATSEGLLLIDKPGGLTSHDVVSRIRRVVGTRKVGHAGTLDPMATGLLVLGIGRATRLLSYLVGADKAYTATIRLGQTTVTDDAEGEITTAPGADVALERIRAEAAGLSGEIEQVPAAVSAVKVSGKRAYARVRAGEQVDLPARPVTIHEFTISAARPTRAADGTEVIDLQARVRCSSGTYVRALARDFGAALGTGGHLSALRRTHVGPFDVADALPLPEGPADVGPPAHLPLAEALRAAFPIRIATPAEARALSYGQTIPSAPSHDGEDNGEIIGVLDEAGTALALVRTAGERAQPVLVFTPA